MRTLFNSKAKNSKAKNSRNGSVFIEAAIIFPLVIAVIAASISLSFELYTVLKDNSIEHKSDIKDKYEKYEKSRLYISFHSDIDGICDGVFYGHDNS